jgi:hypothetical protein
MLSATTPQQLTQQDLHAIVLMCAKQGVHDEDAIAHAIEKSLTHFDPTRAALGTFIVTCAQNRARRTARNSNKLYALDVALRVSDPKQSVATESFDPVFDSWSRAVEKRLDRERWSEHAEGARAKANRAFVIFEKMRDLAQFEGLDLIGNIQPETLQFFRALLTARGDAVGQKSVEAAIVHLRSVVQAEIVRVGMSPRGRKAKANRRKSAT